MNDGASKENLQFDHQRKRIVFKFFFSSRNFLKEIENMFCLFVWSYSNTRDSLGELVKAMETLASQLVFA